VLIIHRDPSRQYFTTLCFEKSRLARILVHADTPRGERELYAGHNLEAAIAAAHAHVNAAFPGGKMMSAEDIRNSFRPHRSRTAYTRRCAKENRILSRQLYRASESIFLKSNQ
jgi:hypothetical protein